MASRLTVDDPDFDLQALKDKYRQERDKRLRSDGEHQYLEVEADFAHFYETDPHSPPVVRDSIHAASPQSGLGEFFALPIFTCAGLMWMASAIDFVMIFVSLELVTVSFYVLVSFTRRNPATLEAGVKYLILSALSTGFLRPFAPLPGFFNFGAKYQTPETGFQVRNS